MPTLAPTLDRANLRPGDRVCAAVSGGADSVALLLLLEAANCQPRNALGVGLSAVHVHHGLRGEEADADQDFVEALCLRLGVSLRVERASVPDRLASCRASGQPESVEEAARAVRYGCFRRLLGEGHTDSVLTAHTLDDQAETVLMKLLRGAWSEGLGGIHPVVRVQTATGAGLGQAGFQKPGFPPAGFQSAGFPPQGFQPQGAGGTAQAAKRLGKIVRPLLGVRRAELIAYLESRGQSWRTDSSNADDAFTRNRVRHQLLPLLREYNPAIDQALVNLAELAREDEARWQAELGRILPQLLLPGKPVRGGGRAVSTTAGGAGGDCVALEIDRLRLLDPALCRRVLRAAARSLGARLSFDETARLLALAGLPPGRDGVSEAGAVRARCGATLQLAGQLRAVRSARELRLYRQGPVKSGKGL